MTLRVERYPAGPLARMENCRWAWPEPRFAVEDSVVLERLTGLYWLQDAEIRPWTMDRKETLTYVRNLDLQLPEPSMRWRLSTINGLESLDDCSRHTPALSAGHPFKNVRDVYWSSTTSFFETAWALFFNKGTTGTGFKKKKTFTFGRWLHHQNRAAGLSPP